MPHECLKCSRFKAIGIETDCDKCDEQAQKYARIVVNLIASVFITYGAIQLFNFLVGRE